MSVRRFEVLGKNIFSISNRILNNEKLRKLLKNSNSDPLNGPDADPDELLHNNVLIVPKIPENDNVQNSFIIIMLDDFVENSGNQEFKTATIRFDILCPYDNWVINANSLRPYLIMSELDKEFNQRKLEGIGNLKFVGAERLVASPYLGGYSMLYSADEFN